MNMIRLIKKINLLETSKFSSLKRSVPIYSSIISRWQSSVIVVGSINADIIVPIRGFPALGETVVAKNLEETGRTVAGGKGANQAVSCRKLGAKTKFICQFGNDPNGIMLEDTLRQNDVDISLCQRSSKPSGLGLAFLQEGGAVSAVVLSGANGAWPDKIDARSLLKKENDVACIMLQMEIPQYINDQISETAAELGIPIFQDVGGEEREISSDHLKRCSYISPNLTELRRLTQLPVSNEEEILSAAKYLQTKGANNVLVTLGEFGSLLLTAGGEIIKQASFPVEKVVDETGAGDNFRAAFVVSHFIDKKNLQDSLAFASASGVVAISKMGAIPACSTRKECEIVLNKFGHIQQQSNMSTCAPNSKPSSFSYKFASRINSMKDRQDLWAGDKGLIGWIQRQGQIKGLNLIDFNYPQHITSPVVTDKAKNEIIEAMNKANLACGAICLRFPKEMQLGAYTHPNPALREKAITLTKQACDWAVALGSNEVVVWSAFDGYDYSLQVDYNELWEQVVSAFQEVCDTYPLVKVSLEYKPTDENTRFFAVPSTGASLLLVDDVNRENFGLTIDFGHCLMAGENPAQSIAMVNRRKGKLFGVQLGDGYGRLGAEDGLAFGSIHPMAAFEFVFWLVKTEYKGHIYFDTFPRNEDPVRECEYNIRQFNKMHALAKRILNDAEQKKTIEKMLANHDAMGMLEYLERLNGGVY